jgi:hypothetical protein
MRTGRHTIRQTLFARLLLPAGLAALLLPCCTPACPPGTPVEIPEFILGTSQGGSESIPLAVQLGGRWMRTQVTWRSVEPVVTNLGITVEDVDAHPGMITDYIQNHDWSVPDAMLAQILAAGLQPLVIVGHGYAGTLPQFEGAVLTPDRIGKENYLGQIYLYARAVVERYNGDGDRDAPGAPVVRFWQLENELNQAFLTAVWGWREPSFLDAFQSAWQDWNFVTRLLRTLSTAVRTEDPEAWTTVNFHTDVPAEINEGFLQPSWENAIRQWVSYIDVIGLDAYPNYYSPLPVKGDVLQARVATAREMGCGKPVVVVETGYPSGPAERGYTEAGQAEFIQEAFDSSVAGGAQGLFLFGVKTGESHGTEITPEDLANLEYLSQLYEQGAFEELLAFALGNAEYLENHFAAVLQTVEPYWGLVRSDGSHKAGWDVFQAIAAGS